MLALETPVFERRNVIEAAAQLGDQRIGGAVIGIGALDEVVTLRETRGISLRSIDEADALRNGATTSVEAR